MQFGLPYGVANTTGQLVGDRARRVLNVAEAHGVRTLDTAQSYGDSEASLGRLGVEAFEIVTKLPGIPSGTPDVARWVADSVRASLDRLRVPSLYGLLLHRPQDLLGPDGPALFRGLRNAREAGLAAKIGVSIYAPDELDALAAYGAFDLIQAPFNILDRRLKTSGWLDRLAAADTEVHARSVFLQGLLLMPAAARPAFFTQWADIWREWDQWLATHETPAIDACLACVFGEPAIARLVVGVDSEAQLMQLLAAAARTPAAWPELAVRDAALITPSSWPRA